jgi:hypothetical protein
MSLDGNGLSERKCPEDAADGSDGSLLAERISEKHREGNTW